MKKKKEKTVKGKKLTAKQLQIEITKLFRRHPRKRLNPKQVVRKLKVDNNQDAVLHALNELSQQKILIEVEDYKFKLRLQAKGPVEKSIHLGKVDMTRTGAAYVVVDDMEEDVFVSQKNMNTALNRDRVKINVWVPPGRRRPEGEVIEVVERATELFIGNLSIYKRYAIITTDGKALPMDVLVDLEDIMTAEDGDKVVFRIKEWTQDREKTPIGEVTTVLGRPGSNNIEMQAILINNGFNLQFPEDVIKESEQLPGRITAEEIARRRDVREVLTFTIDPETAKDFDDALSFRYLEDGHLEVGVHIADVTHFVQAGTKLDNEAFDRSTSVYLVDRVLPMLPERLSNDLCSLRPHEDRLAFSAIFTFDKEDKVVERWFGKTVIHSDRRFTYGEAQAILESGEGMFSSELKKLNQLAKKLRARRFKEGAIDFDSEEVRFILDDKGVPVDVYVKERKDSNMLIEDFMLLANREVATFIARKGKDKEIPFVYRVHDEPNPDKVLEFAKFAKEMGFQLNIKDAKEIGRSYNRLVKAAMENANLKVLEPIAIRTMAKAEYSSDNIGHYGLGFDYYSHFTSPIRRYSDVLAHRILEQNLNNQVIRINKERLEEQCKHISLQERRATDAERESIKYKQVEFMQKHVGEVFKGFISGILDRGIFVELHKNKCEGMAPFDLMPEPFEMLQGKLSFRGLYSGKVYKMGDEVTVQIISTNLAARQIEMKMLIPDKDW